MAQAETWKANPELLNLRCSGVADLPYPEAVAMLRKAERDPDYGDAQVLGRWLAALDELRAAVTPEHVQKSRNAPSGLYIK